MKSVKFVTLVTFYFLKNSFSDISRKCIFPYNIKVVPALIAFVKMHFLIILENYFFHETKHSRVANFISIVFGDKRTLQVMRDSGFPLWISWFVLHGLKKFLQFLLLLFWILFQWVMIKLLIEFMITVTIWIGQSLLFFRIIITCYCFKMFLFQSKITDALKIIRLIVMRQSV